MNYSFCHFLTKNIYLPTNYCFFNLFAILACIFCLDVSTQQCWDQINITKNAKMLIIFIAKI